MKERATQEEVARNAVEQALRETIDKLDQANSKYREVTAKQIPELKSKLETKESKVREGQHALEQLRVQLRKDKKTLVETARQLDRTRQQTIAAKNQLLKTRETISFRFGYLLTHGFKSVNDFVGLPSALWALRKDAIQRHKKKSLRSWDSQAAFIVTVVCCRRSAKRVNYSPIARGTTTWARDLSPYHSRRYRIDSH